MDRDLDGKGYCSLCVLIIFSLFFSTGWCKVVESINRILGESSLLFSLYLSKLLVYLHFVYLENIIQLHPYSCCWFFEKLSICQVKCIKLCLKLLVGHALCIKLKSYSSYETLKNCFHIIGKEKIQLTPAFLWLYIPYVRL